MWLDNSASLIYWPNNAFVVLATSSPVLENVIGKK